MWWPFSCQSSLYKDLENKVLLAHYGKILSNSCESICAMPKACKLIKIAHSRTQFHYFSMALGYLGHRFD